MKSPLAGAGLEAPIGFRFPPRGWLRTALIVQDATSSGLLGGAYLRAIRDFESNRRMKKPPCGGWFGGADRIRTDAYGICSPGPYHLATAP